MRGAERDGATWWRAHRIITRHAPVADPPRCPPAGVSPPPTARTPPSARRRSAGASLFRSMTLIPSAAGMWPAPRGMGRPIDPHARGTAMRSRQRQTIHLLLIAALIPAVACASSGARARSDDPVDGDRDRVERQRDEEWERAERDRMEREREERDRIERN